MERPAGAGDRGVQQQRDRSEEKGCMHRCHEQKKLRTQISKSKRFLGRTYLDQLGTAADAAGIARCFFF